MVGNSKQLCDISKVFQCEKPFGHIQHRWLEIQNDCVIFRRFFPLSRKTQWKCNTDGWKFQTTMLLFEGFSLGDISQMVGTSKQLCYISKVFQLENPTGNITQMVGVSKQLCYISKAF